MSPHSTAATPNATTSSLTNYALVAAERRHSCATQSPPTYRFRGLAATKMPRVKIWMNLLGRWLTTVVFIIAVYAIIIGYERYEVISTRQKRQFNALVTGFLIALALITMSHIINIAVGVKWLILSRGFRSQRKTEAILRAHNISQTVVLAVKSKKPRIHLTALAWVLIFVGSQIGYASVSICYSMGKTENMALLHPGNISIPNMTAIETETNANYSTAINAQQYTANRHDFSILFRTRYCKS
jgi:hypothetical protein